MLNLEATTDLRTATGMDRIEVYDLKDGSHAISLFLGSLTDTQLMAMLDWMSSHVVRELAINDSQLTNEQAQYISNHTACTNLYTLDLRGNVITANGVTWLCSSQFISQVRSLDLSENNIQNKGVKILLDSLNRTLVSLEYLGISCSGVTEAGFQHILDSKFANRLKEIDLSQMEIRYSTREKLKGKYGERILIAT